MEKEIITFGRYKGEDILWHVIARKDGKMLLLSEKCLEHKRYHNQNMNILWYDSDIRKWLNEDFFNSAFTNEDQAVIKRSIVLPGYNPQYDTDAGTTTFDKVFLLSIDEVNEYIGESKILEGKSTQRVLDEKNLKFNSCHWWLRSPGEKQNLAATVFSFGAVFRVGRGVDADDCGVRPAMWIADKTPQKQIKEEKVEIKPEIINPKTRACKIQIDNNMLSFGYYKQENDNEEPIKWRILAHENNKFFIISDSVLDCKKFHNENVDITWENSDIRKWLNNDFINTAFSVEEQKIILNTNVTADYNELAKNPNQGNDTLDQIFLLSIKELKKYFINDEDARAVATPYAQKQGVFVRSVERIKYCSWWLRNIGSKNSDACSVFQSGSDSAFGSRCDDNDGVRPAMWIKIENKALLDKMLNLAFKQEKYIHLGKYPQNTDKPEDVKWRVLARDGEKALIISENILESKPIEKYGLSGDNITWKNSELRKWLNKKFINEVFSIEEQKRIFTTNVILKEKKQNAPILETTEDKLFLLNMEEADKYFRNDKDRQCKATEFAKRDYIYVDSESGNSPWWLNSIPSKKGKNAEVQPPGYINEYGSLVSSNEGVRPSLWISLKDKKEVEKDYLEDLKKEEEKYITLGKYRQNCDNQEPIRWKILVRDNDKALIISDKALDIKPFNIKYVYKTWEESDIRRWLNNEFINEVFSYEEKQKILLTTVTADKNPNYDINPGNDTVDNIFLLSIDDVDKYFDNDLECYFTKYSSDKIMIDTNKEIASWWLRTPGWSETNVSYVNSFGKIEDKGTFIYSDAYIAIRPALWISLKPTNANPKKAINANTNAKYITLGKYKQSTSKKEDIRWRVLTTVDDKALVISENALDCRKYHNERGDITWDKSDLRSWLNTEFINEAFTLAEQKKILQEWQRSEKTYNYNTNAGMATNDRIFLLDNYEVNEYLGNNTECYPTEYAKNSGALINEENGCCNWFVRVPGYLQNYVAYVTTSGDLSVFGCDPDYEGIAIRPAMWVKAKK